MNKTEHMLGLTPYFKRLAYHYLCLGFGEYDPVGYSQYDHVVVKPLYDFQQAPTGSFNEGRMQGGIVVEFFKENKRVRWVDFSVTPSGGGGDPILREL